MKSVVLNQADTWNSIKLRIPEDAAGHTEPQKAPSVIPMRVSGYQVTTALTGWFPRHLKYFSLFHFVCLFYFL